MTDSPAARAERIFLWSGFAWQLCWSSYWTLFFLRVVVDVGLDPVQLVLLGTAKEITILLVEIPTGVVADLRGRRLSVITAYVVCGSAVVLAGVADTFELLLISQVVWSFGLTFRSGAETAWFTDEVDSLDDVDRVLPRRGRFEATGSIVGLVAFSVLASLTSLTLALVAVGFVLLSWSIVLMVRMPETGFVRQPDRERGRFRAMFREGVTACRRPGLQVLVVSAVLAGFASEAVDRLNVARLDEIGLQDAVLDSSLLVGGATVLTSLGTMLVLLVFAESFRGPRLVTLLTSLHVVTAVGVIVLARADLLALAIAGFVVQGTMRSVARTATVGWTNHFTTPANRATVHSFVGQAGSLGEISGGVVLGVLAQQFGIVTAISTSAAVYVLAAVVTAGGRRRWDRAPRTSSTATSTWPTSAG